VDKQIAECKREQPISLVDTHCHLDMDAYQVDFEETLTRARNNGIHHIITIGIDIPSSQKAVDISSRYSFISATVGIHPHDVGSITPSTYTQLAELVDMRREHIVGFGEIGLDYAKKYADADTQKKHFANQLALAADLALPVIIHDRDAHEDILHTLRNSRVRENGGVMHCFSGDYRFAQDILDLGLHISISGVVTFKNAAQLQEVARTIPIESLLLETDGPFLAPQPFRGKRNEPAYILNIAEYIARLRNIRIAELAQYTTHNARALFGLLLSSDV
jgi:TatD DNase family protein